MSKSRWHSKTLWINVIAAVAGLIQAEYGIVMNPAIQVMALSGVNYLLRNVTNEGF